MASWHTGFKVSDFIASESCLLPSDFCFLIPIYLLILSMKNILASLAYLSSFWFGLGIDSCQDSLQPLFVASDFTAEHQFTAGIEGPATDAQGNIFAVNFKEKSTIGKVTPNGVASLFVNLPEGSTGNGIRLNQAGDLLIADYTGHNILKINIAQKQISVYAHHPEMNQPNDLAIMKNQILILSDPNWSASTGNLWKVDLQGKIHLLESDMGTTNGVEVSPDEKTLYVNESVQRNVWAYDLAPNGDIDNKRLFFKFEDFGMDGMRCDAKGNLYVTRHGKGTVAILSPEGKLLREVTLKGKKPSNLAFGGPDGKTCYLTLQDRGCFEQFRTDSPGREWNWR